MARNISKPAQIKTATPRFTDTHLVLVKLKEYLEALILDEKYERADRYSKLIKKLEHKL